MITANILELLGAFFLGACVMLALVWTCLIESDDDEDDDSGDRPARAST
ncbi:MAG TPA: hypothetical protein P5305_01340 [Rubrivivax sp.]|nr:hypothetical protein [Rubrivivax sp.]HRY86496.1 hypothetical protein [Rubrivivax sp.]